MRDINHLTKRVEQLEAEKATLLVQLADNEAEIKQLSDELTETNHGVVALYAELDDKNLALKEASELKSRFLSYMSHEFRTPLGSIRSLARLLLDRMDGPLNDEQAKQVEFIQSSAVELSEMVDDLLDLAKIEAGRVSISPEWFQMVDLFAALRGMFRPLLTHSESVSLFLEEPHDVPQIYTDHKKISQVLRNYISNALKFTQRGEVRVAAQREGEMVTFTVSDTGIGIAPEHLGAVFNDFVQIDSPLQKKWRGTGLGLSLSKRIAELLGGSVGVESEPGVGSIFSLTVPIHYHGDGAPPLADIRAENAVHVE